MSQGTDPNYGNNWFDATGSAPTATTSVTTTFPSHSPGTLTMSGPHSHSYSGSVAIGSSGSTFGYSTEAAVTANADGTVEIPGTLQVGERDVGEFMEAVSRRLLVLEEDLKKHEQYPALKAAYEQYKLIEKLLEENKSDKPK